MTASTTSTVRTRVVAPLYLAGFTTAFGAHGLAAALGTSTDDLGLSLLAFGAVLAVYDLAEVVLKPVFGAWSDRVGVKPVLVGGLVAFAVASLLGAGLLALGGMRALFLALAVLALAATVWAAVAVPRLPVLPRPRYTVADLARQTADPAFLVPTVVLAASTAALGVAVGFLPLLGTSLGLSTATSMAAVTVLALASTAVQPRVGRLRDAGRVSTRAGATAGLAIVTIGVLLVAVAPGVVTVYAAALLVGAGIGVATPLAFAHLAASTPAERMGRSMGNAELGREVGDAGGPLLVGAVAAAVSVPVALGALAVVTAGAAVVGATALRPGAGRAV